MNCSVNDYRELKNGNIVSPDNMEYTPLPIKYMYSGKSSFLSHLRFWNTNQKADVYSLNLDPELTILWCSQAKSEYAGLYIKKEFWENNYSNYSLENCHTFKFISKKTKHAHYWEIENHMEGTIDNDVEIFINDIKKYEKTQDYLGYFWSFDNYIGSIYGYFSNMPALVLCGSVYINDVGWYYLEIDDRIFKLSIDWLKKMGYNE